MKITQTQLSSQLKAGLQVFYWISGDELLLVDESVDALRRECRQQGIVERQCIHADGQFNWQALYEANQAISLFGDRKLIEIRLTGKLNDAGKKALKAYLQNPNPDNVLLLVSPKIEASATKTKWFKEIESQASWLPIWPVDLANLPSWLQARLQQMGYSISTDALLLLSEKVDGNLLAAKQEIEKLSLLAEKPDIDLNTVMQVVADSARYNVFDLTDAILALNTKRSIKILNGLKAEGAEPSIILWALSRELRVCTILKQGSEQGKSMSALYKSQRIWSNKVALYNKALSQLSLLHLHCLLRFSAVIDQTIKGQSKGDVWQLLQEMVFAWVNPTGNYFLQLKVSNDHI